MPTKYTYIIEIRNVPRFGDWEYLETFGKLNEAIEFAQANRKADEAEGIEGYEYRIISQTTTITQVVVGIY